MPDPQTFVKTLYNFELFHCQIQFHKHYTSIDLVNITEFQQLPSNLKKTLDFTNSFKMVEKMPGILFKNREHLEFALKITKSVKTWNFVSSKFLLIPNFGQVFLEGRNLEMSQHNMSLFNIDNCNFYLEKNGKYIEFYTVCTVGSLY